MQEEVNKKTVALSIRTTKLTGKAVSYTHLDVYKRQTQPAIVRPREDGGYEVVSGHRRQKASELAG